MRLRILLLSLGLVGFGPMMCDQPDVETARTQLQNAEAESALSTLAEVEADAPEVHLARAQAYIALERWDDASGSLDQALRGLAERDAKRQAERQIDDLPPQPLAERPSADLRARLLFARGLVTIGRAEAEEDPAAAKTLWEGAVIDFGQVLALRPDDEDARWNMELAWHRANPPCVQRDDDREPDDSRGEAKPIDLQQAPEVKDRLLCPTDEDWYAVEGKRDMILFVRLTGELKPFEEEDTRAVRLALFAPDDERPLREAPMVDGKALVGVTGLEADGVYHIQVSGPGAAEVSYGLQIDFVPPCPVDDPLEENDTPEAATALEDGQKPGLKACPGDADWYRMTVPPGEKRQLKVGFDAERAPLAVERFDALGQVPEQVGRAAQGGMVLDLPSDEEVPVEALVRVIPAGDRENSYSLELAPPQDDSGQDQQDQQDQNEDEQDQNEDEQDQNEDEQDQNEDQQNQNEDQQEQPQPEPEQAIDLDKLIDALDEHERNPQLEKALKELRVVPRMEDY